MAKKKISKVLAGVLNIVLNTVSKKIDDIKAEGLVPLLTLASSTLKKIIDVLSDNDPDDKAQLKVIEREAKQEAIIAYHIYVNENLLTKITDPQLRDGAIMALAAGKEVALALTDDNPDDSTQLKEIVEKYDLPVAEAARDILINKLQNASDNETVELLLSLLELVDLEGIIDPE